MQVWHFSNSWHTCEDYIFFRHIFIVVTMPKFTHFLERATYFLNKVGKRLLDRYHELLFIIKHRNHSVMLRWVLWNNKLQNANKKKISLCLWMAFNFNWFIISGNCIFKLSWLPQLCLVVCLGNEGFRSSVLLWKTGSCENELGWSTS